MKRISLWILSTIAVVVLLFSYHTSTAGTLNVSSSILGTLSASASTGSTVAPSSPPSNSTGGSHKSSNKTSSPSPSASPTTSSSGSGKSGTVTGQVAQTMFGPVQVQIVVSSGKITNVKILQMPQGYGRDIQLDQYALPILMQETINSQSSHIQMISGATYTSGGYIRSLQSAIDKAGI